MAQFTRTRGRRGVAAVLPVALAMLVGPLSCRAWGPEGHIYINRAAAMNLPGSVPTFLKAAADRLGYLGPEPDRWRDQSELTLKQSQEPDHYIDLERITWMNELPRGRYEFYRLLYAHRANVQNNIGQTADDFLPERVGVQPYITIEIYDRLKVAFREYRRVRAARKPTFGIEQNIVLYAGWLGHYVADGSQPMHTTVNFDGWVEANPNGYTREKGIHARFETEFILNNIKQADFVNRVGPPRRLQDPFRDYVVYLRQSHALIGKTYQIDKAGGFTGAGTAEGVGFARERLAAAAQMLRDLWYSAWLESEQSATAPARQ